MLGAIRGLLEQVDPYSGYLNAKDVAFYKDFSVEKTPGIGVILTRANGYPTILEAIPGGPGAKAGLKTFDTIEAIDGVPTREMNLVQAYAYLANPSDKPATLTLIGNNRTEPQTVKVNREVTKAPPVEAKMLQMDIAYVRASASRSRQGQRREETARRSPEERRDGRNPRPPRKRRPERTTEGYLLANYFVDSGISGVSPGTKGSKEAFPGGP